MPVGSDTSIEVQVAVLQRDVGYVREKIDGIVTSLKTITDAAIPLRVTQLESSDCDQDKRLKTVEDSQLALRSEMQGALRALKLGLIIITTIAAVTSTVVGLHALEVIR